MNKNDKNNCTLGNKQKNPLYFMKYCTQLHQTLRKLKADMCDSTCNQSKVSVELLGH